MRTKKKLTYNGRLFKAKRAYSFAEIAEKLNTHKLTVQRWHKAGLKTLEDHVRPFLVMGQALRDFLKVRRQNRKKPLKIGEFFCPRCRKPRRSCPDKLTAQATQRRLGKTYQQVLLWGVCEVCGQRLLLFSSDQKAAEWPKNGLIFTEPAERINGSEISSVNVDILKGRKYGKSKRQE